MRLDHQAVGSENCTPRCRQLNDVLGPLKLWKKREIYFLFIYLFIHSFIHLFIYLFIYLYIYLFIFIYLFNYLLREVSPNLPELLLNGPLKFNSGKLRGSTNTQVLRAVHSHLTNQTCLTAESLHLFNERINML